MNFDAIVHDDASLHESLQRAACAVNRLAREPLATRRRLLRRPAALLLALVRDGFVVADECPGGDAPVWQLTVHDRSGSAQVWLSMVGPFARVEVDDGADRPDQLRQHLERNLRSCGLTPIPSHMLAMPTAIVLEGKAATLGRTLFPHPATSLQRHPGEHHV